MTWCLVVIALVGCSRKSSSPGPTRGYILISIDTLRADHLSCYGYFRPTSPFLDSLAERGVLFENVYAQYPSTLTSHMSLFTGLYPSEHGVYPPDLILSPELETVPEAFRGAGFRTAGYTEGGFVRGRFGFSRGFEEFSDNSQDVNTDVERTFAKGLSFLNSLEPEDRFFLFLHTYAVHTPYRPPEKYRSLYWQQEIPEAPPPTGRSFVRMNRWGQNLSEEAVDYYEALYDASITYVDDVLRRFFAELDALGLTDDVTVILTSDHGEEFLEHGKLVHTQVYRETMHVPLILVHPRLEAGRDRRLAQLVDIAPTLYQLAAIGPEQELSGGSLLSSPGRLRRQAREAYGEVGRGLTRTLLLQRSGKLLQLVATDWNHLALPPREVSFVLESGLESIPIRSDHPGQLKVLVDGALHRELAVSDLWTTVPLPPAADRQWRKVTLLSDIPPPPRRQLREGAAVSRHLQVGHWPLRRVELFDLSRDQDGFQDLLNAHAALAEQLYKRLDGYHHTPRSQPSSEALAPNLEKRLRALGYLE